MKAAVLYFGLGVALGLVFLLLPGIDLAASGLFYVPGQGFPLADWRPLRVFEHTIPLLTRLIVIVCVAGALWLALRGRPLWRLDRKALAFIVLATALGPGLIANTLLRTIGAERGHLKSQNSAARASSPRRRSRPHNASATARSFRATRRSASLWSASPCCCRPGGIGVSQSPQPWGSARWSGWAGWRPDITSCQTWSMPG
jgi:hypothetical protein